MNMPVQKIVKLTQTCIHNQYYEDKTFINEDGTLNMLTLPRIMMAEISKSKNIIELSNSDLKDVEIFHKNNDSLVMHPKDFFCAKNQGTGVIEKTKNTYCIHHFAMSWVPKNNMLFLSNSKRLLMSFFGVKIINFFIKIFWLKQLKNVFTGK